jgi:hypothetical protein
MLLTNLLDLLEEVLHLVHLRAGLFKNNFGVFTTTEPREAFLHGLLQVGLLLLILDC